MATPTVQQIIDRVKSIRAFASMTSNIGLEHAKFIQRDIAAQTMQNEYTLASTPKVVTTLAVGQIEFEIDASLTCVQTVVYKATANSAKTLQPTTIESLGVSDFNWRQSSAGSDGPNYYYIISNAGKQYIGLNPTPSVASSGTPAYPRLQLYGSEKPAEFTLSSEIGNTIYSDGVLWAGICWQASYVLAPEATPHYWALYQEYLSRNQAYLETRTGVRNGGEIQQPRR